MSELEDRVYEWRRMHAGQPSVTTPELQADLLLADLMQQVAQLTEARDRERERLREACIVGESNANELVRLREELGRTRANYLRTANELAEARAALQGSKIDPLGDLSHDAIRQQLEESEQVVALASRPQERQG